MKICLIKMPLYQGCDNVGVDQGSHQIVEAVIKMNPHIQFKVKEVTAFSSNSIKKYETDNTIKYLDAIYTMNTALAKLVDETIAEGYFPITVGGDHALAIGSIAGVSTHYNKTELSAIWFDAHTDINNELTSDSHHAHGMPVAACLGLMDKHLNDVYHQDAKLMPQHLYYIGARSIDPGEKAFIEQLQIYCKTSQDILTTDIHRVTTDLISTIKTPNVHLSLDMDVMDPKFFYATGVKAANGLSLKDVEVSVEMMITHLNIVSLDFVEYHPQLDPNKENLKIASKLLSDIIDVLIKKHS